jgi:hypothetical protein
LRDKSAVAFDGDFSDEQSHREVLAAWRRDAIDLRSARAARHGGQSHPDRQRHHAEYAKFLAQK